MAARISIDALDAHVDRLCGQHRIRRLRGARGRAEVQRRNGTRVTAIRIPPVRGQVTYLIALHEIGHLVGPGRSGTRLEREAAAWRYALRESLVRPTEATRRRIGRRLRSYATWAELRQHRRRPPVLPPPESAFWSLLAELER